MGISRNLIKMLRYYVYITYLSCVSEKNCKCGFAKMSENIVWTPIASYLSRTLREYDVQRKITRGVTDERNISKHHPPEADDAGPEVCL